MYKTNLIKQTLFAVFISLVAFSSCKKEKSDEPATPSKPLQLTEFSDGADVTRFAYNADGSLKTVVLSNDPVTFDNNVTYTVKYLTNKKIDELNASNGAKIKMSYTNGFLSKAEVFAGTDKISQTDYAYTGTVLKSSTISLVDNNTPLPFFKGEFVFNNAGNITKTNAFIYNPLTNKLEASGYVNKQYDNKINPFIALGDVVLVFWQVAPKNNVTKMEYFDAKGKAEEVVETAYTYNAQGFPVKATMKETQPGQQPTTATVTYKYQ
jgi:hypothetical protein